MSDMGADIQPALRAIAERNAVSFEAVKTLFDALVAGQGFQAQFNHPELGGMGQWSQGGMIMIGDMFNADLKAKVGAICVDLAELLRRMPPAAVPRQSQTQGSGQGASPDAARAVRSWWPEELGQAAFTGAQNSLRYAVFPHSRRLAIDRAGVLTVFDTGDHRISGFSQQQSGEQSLSFTSQHGPVRLEELTPVAMPGGNPAPASGSDAVSAASTPAKPASEAPKPSPAAAEHDIFDKIERLAGLHAKGLLTDDEYRGKKAELLARL